jgi:hypothetical protein
MIRIALVASLFARPPVSGVLALILSMSALAVPTAILSLDHSLPAGACCTTYFPFVLLTAVLAEPIYALLVGIGSAGIADALFMGPRYQLLESPMDGVGDLSSMISFALIIGCVFAYRSVIAQLLRRKVSVQSASGIIFSLEDGFALASLPGGKRVPLGPEKEVEFMMRDFLAQCELANRLLEPPN